MSRKAIDFPGRTHRSNLSHCTDQVVGDILSGWRYDISGLSPGMRTDYERHLSECSHCFRRQRVARTIDVLLISISTLSIAAFLLAAIVIRRIEIITHIETVRVHFRDTAIGISLQAVAFAGVFFSALLWILVAIATPLPGLFGSMVQKRIPAQTLEALRDRINRHAASPLPFDPKRAMAPSPHPEGEVLPPMQPAPLPDYAEEPVAPPTPFGSNTQAYSRPRRRASTTATWILLSINVAVFLWMLFRGVSLTNPSPDDLVRFGANVTDLVLFRGQWYRLLTATFVHVGIIHLATNMWCLYNLGLLGEPLLGAWGIVAVYLLTGIAGNLLSLGFNVILAIYRHDPSGFFSVGAGASGAVFGIAGILIILLSNKKLPIPLPELARLRRSVIQFAGLNLLIGLGTVFVPLVRIDNFAHLGGFLSGLALGPPLVPRMISGRRRYLERQKITFGVAAFVLILFAYWVSKLR